MTVLYTGRVHVESGRNGTIRSEDEKLDAKLAFPKALGGDGSGTNPEQLFGAGYAACFASTIAHIAKTEGQPVGRVSVDAEVDMLQENGAYDLAVRLVVSADGPSRAALEAIVEKAKVACPYSRATRTTIPTTVRIS